MKLHCFAVLFLSVALLAASRVPQQEAKQKSETAPPTASRTFTPDASKIAIEMVVEELIENGPVVKGPVLEIPVVKGPVLEIPELVTEVVPGKRLEIQLLSKGRIEGDLKNVVASGSGPNNAEAVTTKPLAVQFLSKGLIEGDLKNLVVGSEVSAESDPKIVTPDNDDNPTCQPGLINWHADFATACSMSERSGKPVMLFQLLGQLDERFT